MAILELENISKHFGAIQAVTDVSLVLEPGQVVGLMGDNGAGKSTLVKVIAGNFRPSHGTMRMEGAELVLHRPVEARQHGIEIVHQDLALCDNLTAAANVFLAREMLKGVGEFAVLDDAADELVEVRPPGDEGYAAAEADPGEIQDLLDHPPHAQYREIQGRPGRHARHVPGGLRRDYG